MKVKEIIGKPDPSEYKARAKELVNDFKGKKICIVGDIIADIYIFGKPYRLSREAPVVVIEYEEERLFPGSAGNTINNLLSLGADVYPVGIVGSDSAGDRLIDYFSRFENMHMDGIFRYEGETVTKTRILAGDTHTSKQQVIRIDRDSRREIPPDTRQAILKKLRDYASQMDGFILSDYGHGVVDNNVITKMAMLAKKKVVVGDSRYNLKAFKGFTLITPNEGEAYHLSGLNDACAIDEVGEKILSSMNLASLLITRGNRGMNLFLQNGQHFHIPISGKDDVTDVTGAGDTVCATATLALASGADFYTAAALANQAAGIVVMKRGTATVSLPELKKVIR